MERALRVGCALVLTQFTIAAPGAGSRPSSGPVASKVEADTTAVRVPPALLVKVADDKPSEPLTVDRVDVQVVITGFLAETTTTLTFHNDYDRALEGDLVFPLPEGSTVSAYGLDVGGEMIDGVVVERQEARVAFENEVRRGIDPGLVEWVQGNSFRTRVWPIPAHGNRTVRVQYVSDLVTQGAGDAREALYALPLRFRGTVREFVLRIEVLKGTVRPEVREGLGNFRFERWEDHYVARTHATGVALEEDLLIALPRVPPRSAVVETGEDGETYFVIDDFPDVPPVAASAPATARPRSVGLLWDASLSRAKADKRRELGVLEGWLKRVRDVDLDVVVFRNVPAPERRFSVRAGGTSEVLAFLHALDYDGGTDLGALRFGKGHDFDLLFTDGLASLSEKGPGSPGAPLYAVTADPQADHALLASLAQKSGGDAFNLQRMTDEDVIEGLGRPAFALLAVDSEPGAIADVFPSGRRSVRGRLTLTGRLMADEARLTLRYGDDAPSHSRTYSLRRADAVAGRLVPRYWAQQKVAELSVFPGRNHDELLRLGRRFGVVTPGASLLVLESVEQYLRHGVEPPRTRPQVRAEYRRRLEQQQAARKRTEADKLERVVRMWSQRVEWWQRHFEPEAALRAPQRPGVTAPVEVPMDIGVEGGVPEGVVGGVVAGIPEVAPPPLAVRVGGALAGQGRFAADARREGGGKTADSGGATVVLRPWDPDTPYLTAIRKAGASRAYAAYLQARDTYGTSPAFYLDCADHFLREGPRELGLRILTNVPELELQEPRLLRVAAHRLKQIGETGLAIDLFEKVLRLRPEEPQSRRDLALALEARADARLRRTRRGSVEIAADYLRAIELLNRVVLGEWDGRFPEIEVIALEEANRMIAVLDRDLRFGRPTTPIDARLRKLLDVDVRIVLTWDTDQTDMDLWVIEPSGEKCFYSHPRTLIGGMISSDFTGGYGPEEYLVRRALRGDYRVQANFYGSRSQTLTGPTTVQATVITAFGRPDERRQGLTLRLTTAREVVDVGAVHFGPEAAKMTP